MVDCLVMPPSLRNGMEWNGIEGRWMGMKMSLSQKRVFDLIQTGKEFSMDDMGFILTVLRDGCTDEKTHYFIDVLVHELWELRGRDV